MKWSRDGHTVFFVSAALDRGQQTKTYAFPVAPGKMFPSIPTGGFRSEAEMAKTPGARSVRRLRFRSRAGGRGVRLHPRVGAAQFVSCSVAVRPRRRTRVSLTGRRDWPSTTLLRSSIPGPPCLGDAEDLRGLSIVSPPKYRSSTIRACCGSNAASRSSDSWKASTSIWFGCRTRRPRL